MFLLTYVGPDYRFLAGAKYVIKNSIFQFVWSKNGKKNVEIEGVGPIWRDPRRNSAEFRTKNVNNGRMATRLVTKRCDFWSLGVPGPASTPKPTNQPTNQPTNCWGPYFSSIFLPFSPLWGPPFFSFYTAVISAPISPLKAAALV